MKPTLKSAGYPSDPSSVHKKGVKLNEIIKYEQWGRTRARVKTIVAVFVRDFHA
jgi:hypothetical protein